MTYAIGIAMIALSVATDIKESVVLFDQKATSGQPWQKTIEDFGEMIRFTSLRKLDRSNIYSSSRFRY